MLPFNIAANLPSVKIINVRAIKQWNFEDNAERNSLPFTEIRAIPIAMDDLPNVRKVASILEPTELPHDYTVVIPTTDTRAH